VEQEGNVDASNPAPLLELEKLLEEVLKRSSLALFSSEIEACENLRVSIVSKRTEGSNAPAIQPGYLHLNLRHSSRASFTFSGLKERGVR